MQRTKLLQNACDPTGAAQPRRSARAPASAGAKGRAWNYERVLRRERIANPGSGSRTK